MKYRIVKTSTWWTNMYDTGMPQFLYYDYDLEHFEVANYQAARKGKWEFTEKELRKLAEDYYINDEFMIESVRSKSDEI